MTESNSMVGIGGMYREIYNGPTHRSRFKILRREWLCCRCRTWSHENRVTFAAENGRLSTAFGKVYCDACLPENL